MASRKSAYELPTMTFGQHIEELRRRLIFAILGFAVAAIFTMIYGRTIVAIIYEPLTTVQRLGHLPPHLYTRSTLAGMMIYVKVSMVAALLLSAPWILYQIWRFIEVGLYPTERRAAMSLMFLSALMTTIGLWLFYYIFLPAALAFLIFWTTSYPIPKTEGGGLLERATRQFITWNDQTFGIGGVTPVPATLPATTSAPAPVIVPALRGDPPHPVEGQVWYNQLLNEMRVFQDGRILVITMSVPSAMMPLIDPSDYLNEVMWFAIVVVAVFHIPVVMAFLGMVGIGSPAWLARQRRYIIFGLFALCVVFAPGQDIFSNIALPLLAWLLFEFGLLLMRIFLRRRQRILDAEAAD